MDLLRTQVSLLGMSDPDVASNTDDANRGKATRLVAQTPALIATSERISAGLAPADVDPSRASPGTSCTCSTATSPTPPTCAPSTSASYFMPNMA